MGPVNTMEVTWAWVIQPAPDTGGLAAGQGRASSKKVRVRHGRWGKGSEVARHEEALQVPCKEPMCVPPMTVAVRSLPQKECLQPTRIHQRNNNGQERRSQASAKRKAFHPFSLISFPDLTISKEERMSERRGVKAQATPCHYWMFLRPKPGRCWEEVGRVWKWHKMEVLNGPVVNWTKWLKRPTDTGLFSCYQRMEKQDPTGCIWRE